MSCISLHLGKNYGAVCITGSLDQKKKKMDWGEGGCPADLHKSKDTPPPQTCIKGKCILCSVTGSQDFAGGQGHWRASHCRRAGLHGGQGRA